MTLPRMAFSQLPSGTRVELGATWFHGIQGNPLYDIAVWEGLIRDLRGDPGEPNRHPHAFMGHVTILTQP